MSSVSSREEQRRNWNFNQFTSKRMGRSCHTGIITQCACYYLILRVRAHWLITNFNLRKSKQAPFKSVILKTWNTTKAQHSVEQAEPKTAKPNKTQKQKNIESSFFSIKPICTTSTKAKTYEALLVINPKNVVLLHISPTLFLPLFFLFHYLLILRLNKPTAHCLWIANRDWLELVVVYLVRSAIFWQVHR